MTPVGPGTDGLKQEDQTLTCMSDVYSDHFSDISRMVSSAFERSSTARKTAPPTVFGRDSCLNTSIIDRLHRCCHIGGDDEAEVVQSLRSQLLESDSSKCPTEQSTTNKPTVVVGVRALLQHHRSTDKGNLLSPVDASGSDAEDGSERKQMTPVGPGTDGLKQEDQTLTCMSDVYSDHFSEISRRVSSVFEQSSTARKTAPPTVSGRDSCLNTSIIDRLRRCCRIDGDDEAEVVQSLRSQLLECDSTKCPTEQSTTDKPTVVVGVRALLQHHRSTHRGNLLSPVDASGSDVVNVEGTKQEEEKPKLHETSKPRQHEELPLTTSTFSVEVEGEGNRADFGATSNSVVKSNYSPLIKCRGRSYRTSDELGPVLPTSPLYQCQGA